MPGGAQILMMKTRAPKPLQAGHYGGLGGPGCEGMVTKERSEARARKSSSRQVAEIFCQLFGGKQDYFSCYCTNQIALRTIIYSYTAH